jgi:hypothetical protein
MLPVVSEDGISRNNLDRVGGWHALGFSVLGGFTQRDPTPRDGRGL